MMKLYRERWILIAWSAERVKLQHPGSGRIETVAQALLTGWSIRNIIHCDIGSEFERVFLGRFG